MRLPQGDSELNVSEFFFVFRSELLACEADPRVTGAPYREVNYMVALAPKHKVQDKDRVT